MLLDDAARRQALGSAANRFGTPCFVYFADQVTERIRRLRETFGPRFQIAYAVKSNPNPSLLARLRPQVESLDVSSLGEVRLALRAGWSPQALGFTGPGKTQEELESAVSLRVGLIVVESTDEAELLNRIAGGQGRRQAVLVRVAPRTLPRGFGLNMSGRPSAFGIDEEESAEAVRRIAALAALDLVGFHAHSGSQCLDVAALVENYAICAELFRSLAEALRKPPRRLVFGSGIGIPYHEGDTGVDLGRLADALAPVRDLLQSDPWLAAARPVLETGRYLVGEAGAYVTRVVRRKESRGTPICICDGGMNHHLAAAGHLGTVVQRNFPIAHLDDTGDPGAKEESVQLVGPLCTTLDTIGRGVRLRGVRPGSLIAVACSGAYGPTASPLHFLSHRPPREILVENVDGEARFEDASWIGSPVWGPAREVWS